MIDRSSPPLPYISCHNEQDQIEGEDGASCIYKKIGNDLIIQIGSGSFGKVYKAMNELTSEIVAIKEIALDSSMNKNISKKKIYYYNEENYTTLNLIQNEINVLKILNDTQNDEKNHNIIKYYESFQNSNSVCLVIEYCPGGNLLNYINAVGALSESLAGNIFGQITEAINYCNSEKFIAHRDLKLENILIVSMPVVKLADFGMSISTMVKDCPDDETSSHLCTTFGGSIFYSAPEIICKIPYDPILADIWSLGVILYIMVSGSLPWYIDNRCRGGKMNSSGFNDSTVLLTTVQTKQVMKQIMAGTYQPLPDSVSSECKKLIFSMLQINPKKRATIEQILESPWLEKTRTLTPVMPDESQVRTSLVDSLPHLHYHKSKKKINQSSCSNFQHIKQSSFSKSNYGSKKRSSINPRHNAIPIPMKKKPTPANSRLCRSKFTSIKSHSNCLNLVNK